MNPDVVGSASADDALLETRISEIRARYNAVNVEIAPQDTETRILVASWEDIPELLEQLELALAGVRRTAQERDRLQSALEGSWYEVAMERLTKLEASEAASQRLRDASEALLRKLGAMGGGFNGILGPELLALRKALLDKGLGGSGA